MLDLNISNELGPELRNQLIDNFTMIDNALSGEREVSQEQLDIALKGLRSIVYTVNAGSDKGDSPVELQLLRTNVNGHQFKNAAERIDGLERAIISLGGILDV